MKSYDPAVEAALEEPSIIRRGLVLFDFPSGNHGFWEGSGILTWNSIDFFGGGQLIEVDAGEQSTEMSAKSITLRLYANLDVGLTPTILGTIENENYHQRPVTFYKAFFDADTRELIDVVAVWRGYVDTVSHERDGEKYAIVGRLESRSLDYSRRGWAIASNAQQQQISSGDIGLEYTGIVGEVPVYFGVETPKNLAPPKISSGPVI